MSATWFLWKQISPWCWTAQGDGGNSLVVACASESVLIDTKMPGFGATLRREAEMVSGSPIRTVINTHHHRDHVGGNNVFTKNCAVMMHEKGIARIRSLRDKVTEAVRAAHQRARESEHPSRDVLWGELDEIASSPVEMDAFVPNRVVRGSEVLTIGGVRIELMHWGNGHSDNDLVVWIPSQNVLHSGDLLFNHQWPYVDRGGGMDSAGWIAGCEKILGMCDEKTVVVPGHGESEGREAAVRQRDLLKDLKAQAENAVGSGMKREAFLSLEFEAYKQLEKAERLKPMALGGFWDEAMGIAAP